MTTQSPMNGEERQDEFSKAIRYFGVANGLMWEQTVKLENDLQPAISSRDQQIALAARTKELGDFIATLKSSHLCEGGSETSDTVQLIVFMLERKIKYLATLKQSQESK